MTSYFFRWIGFVLVIMVVMFVVGVFIFDVHDWLGVSLLWGFTPSLALVFAIIQPRWQRGWRDRVSG